MARIWQSGFEMNDTGTIEWNIGGFGSPTISTTTVRTGNYAGRIGNFVSGTSQRFVKGFTAADSINPFFFRIYINIATLPSATNRIIALRNSAGASRLYVELKSNGQLNFVDNAAGQIGSSSTAMTTNTWNCIEIHYDATGGAGAAIYECKLNGIIFSSKSTGTIADGLLQFLLGGNLASEAQTQGEWFYDDVAINDSNGGNQNSWCGGGGILHLKPIAPGDANSFATQTGGQAGSNNNFTRVQEVTPNDATNFNGSNTLNQEDLFNMDNSGLDANNIINVVSVGVRFRNNTADATTAVKVEIEKASGGTISQSAAIVPNSTTWKTDDTAAVNNYPLVLYVDPDGAAWTPSTVDSLQAGYKLTTGGTNRIDVSTVWVEVDYVPAPKLNNTNDLDQELVIR